MADTPTICPYCDSMKTRPLPPTIPNSRVKWLFCDGCRRPFPAPPRIAPFAMKQPDAR
jgi:hypothetical protein